MGFEPTWSGYPFTDLEGRGDTGAQQDDSARLAPSSHARILNLYLDHDLNPLDGCAVARRGRQWKTQRR